MGLEYVTATSNGFYFFQFKTVAYMEEIIEGGLGSFKANLLSYKVGNTAWLCSVKNIRKFRLDYARVCILLDYHSVLPKHLVVISPILREGKEIPTRVDVEYEWLPQRCKQCCSLGHSVAACPEARKKGNSVPVAVFVKKKQSAPVDSIPSGGEVAGQSAEVEDETRSPQTIAVSETQFRRQQQDLAQDGVSLRQRNKGKGIAISNPFEVLTEMEAVGQLVREHGIQFLGLIETRVGQVNVQRTRAHLLRNWSWFDDYTGPGGRIWITWNNLEVGVEVLRVETQLIHCKVTNKSMHTTCLITVVYGECSLILRRELWAGILSLADVIAAEPWILLGDFNAVLDSSEVCGRAAETGASMEEFRESITTAELVHLPCTGCPFTWHNCSEGSRSLWKRLDRMLVNEMWLVKWPYASYLSALPSTSDHSPLILLGTASNKDPIPFRFDNFLAEQPNFLDSVKQIWRHQIHGTSMYGVTCKLKSLKTTFRAQHKEKGDLADNVRKAKAFLDIAQALFDSYKEDYLLVLVQCCRLVYCAAIKIENSMLQQRAKLHWLKYGDQCSKLLFRKINGRRAQQRVFQITTQSGQLLTDMPQVTAEFVSFFQNLLGANRRRRELNLTFLQQGLKHVLTREEGEGLIAPVSMAEIKEAFFDISIDSAPGLDGYPSLFFKAAWPEIGNEVCAAVTEFFQSGRLLKQINATLLTLIPKVQLPTCISDYRPISCCNVIYKAITKIMVKMMQRVLHLLIHYSQNAFVPGRSISDNILLAQELLAGYNQSKLPPRCTIKIDIQKAYDSVEWNFLLEGLRVFNFPPKFIAWIEQVRVADHFQYHWKCKELGLLNLCFADDVLLFCKGTVQSVQVIRDALAEFATMSGLQISPMKSQIILSRSVQTKRQQILDMMGFQEGTLPIKYLGVPLVSSRLSRADCHPLIQKVDRRLAGWNHLTLSFAGRVQLIKSVLSSLHTYWASAFILPKAVLKVIEERMRSFLWKGASGRGAEKVSWKQICRPKKEGGLGIRQVVYMNQSLMLKYIWCILQEDKRSIWVAWVLRYQLQNQTLWTAKVSNATWCWKKLVNLSAFIKPGLNYRVGNGYKFKLWLDLWHERIPLIITFPRGPSITGLPSDSFLHEVLRNGHWTWPSETDFVVNKIVSCLLNTYPGESYSILWKSNSGRFSTAAALALLQPPSPYVLWNGLLEGRFKIPRHVFILWLAIKERLSTMDRPWFGQQGAECVLCNNSSAEFHSHLFFHCAYSRRCLAVLKYTVRFQWPGFEHGILWASRRWRGSHLLNAASRSMLASLVYHLWFVRNNCRFKATATSAESVALRAFEDVRLRIISTDINPSLQAQTLYRVWRIPWYGN
ncbi:UNVERIFIED_CONTAM: hypothetical protein Slati_0871600 [Sesamum latifolium]|uniref:Reverse transcriptase domain-containing protein n=1 Tax=Sesamum latifolium TaxID=2727402 RepID=A0AAW2XQ86_9LAMI